MHAASSRRPKPLPPVFPTVIAVLAAPVAQHLLHRAHLEIYEDDGKEA